MPLRASTWEQPTGTEKCQWNKRSLCRVCSTEFVVESLYSRLKKGQCSSSFWSRERSFWLSNSPSSLSELESRSLRFLLLKFAFWPSSSLACRPVGAVRSVILDFWIHLSTVNPFDGQSDSPSLTMQRTPAKSAVRALQVRLLEIFQQRVLTSNPC